MTAPKYKIHPTKKGFEVRNETWGTVPFTCAERWQAQRYIDGRRVVTARSASRAMVTFRKKWGDGKSAHDPRRGAHLS